MNIYFETYVAKVSLDIKEDSFVKFSGSDSLKKIALFNTCQTSGINFKITPVSVVEAMWMITAYCELTKLKEPIPGWLASYFNDAFCSLLGGMPPANALGLVNAPHRPKSPSLAERDKQIYKDVALLMAGGASLFDAALEVSERRSLHESTIQKIYSAYKKLATDLAEFEVIDNLPF